MASRAATCWSALLLLPLLWGGVAFARVDIAPLSLTAPLVWSGGDITYSYDYCIVSTDEPNPSGNTPVPYRMTAFAPFALASGASQIPFSVAWRDLYTAQTRTLLPGVATAYVFSGAAPGCPSGNNGRVTITILEATLLAAPIGNYSATLIIEAGSQGQGRPKLQGTINLTLTIGGLIRIGQLTDISLGVFDGISNLSASDSLCVYRNFAGSYGVRVSGQGAGGAFVLVNGASQVVFDVTWNDGSGAAVVSPGALLSGRVGAYVASPDCAGGAANNATLGVSATAASMNAATATGLHAGLLTITVEPQ